MINMNSKNADVQNINYVVEQGQQLHNFAKIYLNKTPWAHLDIALWPFLNMEEL